MVKREGYQSFLCHIFLFLFPSEKDIAGTYLQLLQKSNSHLVGTKLLSSTRGHNTGNSDTLTKKQDELKLVMILFSIDSIKVYNK